MESDAEMNDDNLTPAESFRRAKIEHYLDRAHEYVDMARYNMARRTLESIQALDPGNADSRILEKTIEESFKRILHRTNGYDHSANGEIAPGQRHKRTELVLVVDQDEQLLVSLTQTLRKYGFQSISAASYEEAVETMATIKPDVVISEINFENGPRGFDLYLWLKTNTGQLNIPFLFLAARIDREMLIASKRFGVDDLILKPVDDEVVTASIINSLARRKRVPQTT